MKIIFYKYQGNGNDFIMINNLNGAYNGISKKEIQLLCDRNFGIGSDGLILINKSENLDFEMKFFNPDASSSFCGNGARCAVAFAKYLGVVNHQIKFSAFDGIHEAFVSDDKIKFHILQKSIFAVAKSGTISLEVCNLKIPSIILYKMNFINF